jgi:hypothetical protein
MHTTMEPRNTLPIQLANAHVAHQPVQNKERSNLRTGMSSTWVEFVAKLSKISCRNHCRSDPVRVQSTKVPLTPSRCMTATPHLNMYLSSWNQHLTTPMRISTDPMLMNASCFEPYAMSRRGLQPILGGPCDMVATCGLTLLVSVCICGMLTLVWCA